MKKGHVGAQMAVRLMDRVKIPNLPLSCLAYYNRPGLT